MTHTETLPPAANNSTDETDRTFQNAGISATPLDPSITSEADACSTPEQASAEASGTPIALTACCNAEVYDDAEFCTGCCRRFPEMVLVPRNGAAFRKAGDAFLTMAAAASFALFVAVCFLFDGPELPW